MQRTCPSFTPIFFIIISHYNEIVKHFEETFFPTFYLFPESGSAENTLPLPNTLYPEPCVANAVRKRLVG